MSFFEKCTKAAVLAIALTGATGSAIAQNYYSPSTVDWGAAHGNRYPHAGAYAINGYIVDQSGTNGKCVKLQNYNWHQDIPGTRTCVGNQWRSYNVHIGGGIPCMYEENGRMTCFHWR